MSLTAQDIKDHNIAYHDAAAEEYDAKWGIDYGEVGRSQVAMKTDKVLGKNTHFPRALEIGSGTGYLSLNMMQNGVIGEVVCTDISQGMLDVVEASAEAPNAMNAAETAPAPIENAPVVEAESAEVAEPEPQPAVAAQPEVAAEPETETELDEVAEPELAVASDTVAESVTALSAEVIEAPAAAAVVAEVETAEVETAEVETAEVETAEVETAEVETAEVETAEVETAEAETAEAETAEVETAEVETAEVEAAEVEAAPEVTLAAVVDAAPEASAKPVAAKPALKIHSLFGDDEQAAAPAAAVPEVIETAPEIASESTTPVVTEPASEQPLEDVVIEPSKKSKRKAKQAAAREAEKLAATQPLATPEPVEAEARELEVVGDEDEADVELTPAKPRARSTVSVDELVFKAGCLFVERQRVAVSMLQREFGLDFDAATTVLDQLQRAGLIGPYLGGQRRDILLSLEEWQSAVSVE